MRIAILHASAGHGHAKVAESVREGFLACGLKENEILLFDALDETPALFRRLYTASYFYAVKHTPALWGWSYALMDQPVFYRTVGYPFRRFVNNVFGQGLIRRIEKEKPDAVLCTHFFAPEVLGHAKQQGRIRALLLSVVTDFLPHTFWINPGTDHYWVMSEEGMEILLGHGVPEDQITPGGIPISLQFRYQGKRQQSRLAAGLKEEPFTILITSGSFGLGPTEEVLEALNCFGDRIQVMIVAGKNHKLQSLLESRRFPFLTKIYGFVSNMDELMEASDLIIAKPGGATTTESLAKGVPLVVLDPIPGQEAGNAKLLKERNASFFLGSPDDIQIILKSIMDYPEVLNEKRRAMQRLARPEASIELARFVIKKIESAS